MLAESRALTLACEALTIAENADRLACETGDRRAMQATASAVQRLERALTRAKRALNAATNDDHAHKRRQEALANDATSYVLLFGSI
jgi:hypothetical protein